MRVMKVLTIETAAEKAKSLSKPLEVWSWEGVACFATVYGFVVAVVLGTVFEKGGW